MCFSFAKAPPVYLTEEHRAVLRAHISVVLKAFFEQCHRDELRGKNESFQEENERLKQEASCLTGEDGLLQAGQ